MGIYDRDYMNDSDDAPGRHRLSAANIMIIVNVAVWLVWQFAWNNQVLAEFMENNFTTSVVGVVGQYRIHTLFTYAISHIQFEHILFNMIFYWILASDVEYVYGFKNFFVIYFFCGLLASLGYLGLSYLQGNYAEPMLGASGAILGLAVIAAIFNPDKPLAIFGIIPVKLKWLVVFYIVFDFVGALDQRSHIAHAAHLGGALGGYLFWKLDLRVFGSPGRPNAGLSYRVRRFFRRQPPMRLVEHRWDDNGPETFPRTPEAAPHAPSQNQSVDAETSRRVDELLGKIHRLGIQALSDEERAFLNASSQKYRRDQD